MTKGSDTEGLPKSPATTRDHCLALIKASDYDRYVLCLTADTHLRPGLLACYALMAEAEQIPKSVNEAALGEMRYQWWREFLPEIAEGRDRGHPTAKAFSDLAPGVLHANLPMVDDYLAACADSLYSPEAHTVDNAVDLAARMGGTIEALACSVAGHQTKGLSGEPGDQWQGAEQTGTAYFLIDTAMKALLWQSARPALWPGAAPENQDFIRDMCNRAMELLQHADRRDLPRHLKAMAALGRRKARLLRRARYNPADLSVLRPRPMLVWRTALWAALWAALARR